MNEDGVFENEIYKKNSEFINELFEQKLSQEEITEILNIPFLKNLTAKLEMELITFEDYYAFREIVISKCINYLLISIYFDVIKAYFEQNFNRKITNEEVYLLAEKYRNRLFFKIPKYFDISSMAWEEKMKCYQNMHLIIQLDKMTLVSYFQNRETILEFLEQKKLDSFTYMRTGLKLLPIKQELEELGIEEYVEGLRDMVNDFVEKQKNNTELMMKNNFAEKTNTQGLEKTLKEFGEHPDFQYQDDIIKIKTHLTK